MPMTVTKRNGTKEPVSFDKILKRIQSLAHGLSRVDVTQVSQKTIVGLYDGVDTSHLDALAAETSAYMASTHPEYAFLGARIELSNLYKQTPPSLLECVTRSNLHPDVLAFIEAHIEALESAVDHTRDERYDFFAVKTLKKSYLRMDPKSQKIVERPQFMLMRIAAGIHHKSPSGLAKCLETYDALSRGEISHATPTMFNSGTNYPQLASCFLMTIPTDSMDGILQAVTWCGTISKYAGGIGLDITKVRSKGSYIRGSDGVSNGIVPMLRVFDGVARYVDQGGGKRKGAIAIYLEPWHPEIFEFLELKKNHGKEELRARDLSYGLWIPDLFMKRVESDSEWSLFCPDNVPELTELYGDAFDEAYTKLEGSDRVRRVVKARDVWNKIIESQIETGYPYMLYKDTCNKKSNQSHLGPLRCSNLCTEILEYVDKDEIAVCNLASVALPMCIDGASFDFAKLERLVAILVRNLNNVIDTSYYPLEETRLSNMRHRPIGIGVQGLADVFNILRMPFDSDEAMELNEHIFETMYYAALSESISLAEEYGTYASYAQSPLSLGKLQPDLWGHVLTDMRHDWSGLRLRLSKHGARNSLLMAPMPTASTAQILGNTECFEPITSNMFTRQVLAGSFPVINKRLVADLEAQGKWTQEVRDIIVRDNGSIQNVPGIDDELKLMYRTVWEMKMRKLIDMAAARGKYICQSQSLNLFMEEPTTAKITSMHLYAWKKGLKTGIYYLRSRAAADAAKVTLSPAPPANCVMCSA